MKIRQLSPVQLMVVGALLSLTPVARADSLITVANPALVTLTTSQITLVDTATLAGVTSPASGTIHFQLMQGASDVFDELVTVSGNGLYTGAVTLPTSGAIAGSYNWLTIYSGDQNNAPATATPEPVTVNPASPSLVTVAAPPSSGTVVDTATLSGAYFPAGSLITFSLIDPSNQLIFNELVTVSGNGMYTGAFTLPSNPAPGTYSWVTAFGGDANNSPFTAAVETFQIAPVPESSALLLLATGLLALVLPTWLSSARVWNRHQTFSL
jgi:hypothetical protein